MKRRSFIKSSLIVGSSSSILLGCEPQQVRTKPGKDHVSGFIFSDAHIGWRGADQPTVEAQHQAIRVIKNKFKSLDVVFDTGDIHHGYLNEAERNEARDHWLTIMANQFPDSFFHYVAGNHELGKGPYDTELTAAKIGSMNFRPYYSFDHQGIHFVSLPQLLDTILINKESLQWLDHDLMLNKHKTTLIFSHNSIAGTTYSNDETGYRVVVNSEDLLKVINKHPNVLGWFHGHNHQYEVVNKDNRLYVSNGRIGGFDPPESWGPFGQGHLGGVYFSVSKKGLVVRCFSATANQFFDEIGSPNLSNKISRPTSFDAGLKSNYYFGHGQLSDNVEYKLNSHFLSSEAKQVFLQEHQQEVINDNADFAYTTELYFIGKRIKRLIGYQLLPTTLERKTVPEGLMVDRQKNEENVVLKFPSYKFTKFNFMVRGSYYRCEAEDVLMLNAEFSDLTNQSKMVLGYLLYDEFQNILFESDFKDVEMTKGGSFQHQFQIPADVSNQQGSNKYIKFMVKLTGFPKQFVVKKMAVKKLVPEKSVKLIKINDVSYDVSAKKSFSLTGTESVKNLKFRGQPSSLIFKVPDVDWQVRNAEAQYTENSIEVSSYRHTFQKRREVILTPLNHVTEYLSKTTDIMPFKVEYESEKIKIWLDSYSNESTMLIRFSVKPSNLIGAELISMQANAMLIKPNSRQVLVSF